MVNWSELVETRPLRITLMVMAFLTLFLVIGFALPAKWRVEQAVTISAPPTAIFPYLNNLKKWRDWTVWYDGKPDLQVEYSGPATGVGATSRWQDDDGRGVMKIMNSRPNTLVEYMLIFDGGEWVMDGALRLTPVAGGKTELVWRAGGEAGANPLQRYMALAIRLFVGRDFGRSLEKLRAMVEAQAEPVPEPAKPSAKQK